MSNGQSKTHSLPSSWSTHADQDTYSIVERITTPLCKELIGMTNALKFFDPTSSYVFDNGAGTGILTAQLKAHNSDLKIFATDISSGMIQSLQSTIQEQDWSDVETAVADSQDLTSLSPITATTNTTNNGTQELPKATSLSDSTFTHTLSTFMIGSVEQPHLAIAETYRVTAPNGILALGAWAGGAWGPVWQKAVRLALGDESYVAPRLMHKDWSDIDDVVRGVEIVGWKVHDAKIQKANWGFKDADEVDQYIFEGRNPIVGLLMEGFSDDKLKACREGFKRIVKEKYDNGRELCETAILLTAIKK
ncbi:hypothetical protein CBER1_10499 [Cercospora berteroae]|uniref:Methyltransferase type 11 domain-containing protein n=1 Tax=Cercospora berteroae TaxID=357750 RepID=A0A2S6BYA7_9PEZI|nr:hypothetical protein CBER1_10499 [Cercospora berteroae]